MAFEQPRVPAAFTPQPVFIVETPATYNLVAQPVFVANITINALAEEPADNSTFVLKYSTATKSFSLISNI